jgi:hypothetical protein
MKKEYRKNIKEREIIERTKCERKRKRKMRREMKKEMKKEMRKK